MSRKNGTEGSFQEKFKDRMENIGKDGISSIMRNMENPINKNNYNNRVENWANLYNQGNIFNLNILIRKNIFILNSLKKNIYSNF